MSFAIALTMLVSKLNDAQLVAQLFFFSLSLKTATKCIGQFYLVNITFAHFACWVDSKLYDINRLTFQGVQFFPNQLV